MKKLYEEIIDGNCQKCPACHSVTGQGYYECSRLGMNLGYDDDYIAIPSECPLKDVK
jgi:hypothetical protein